MSTQRFMAMDAQQSQQLVDATEGRDYVLRPREIEAGPNAGVFVLPVRIKTDENYSDFWETLAALEEIDVDPVVAWPPVPDDPDEE